MIDTGSKTIALRHNGHGQFKYLRSIVIAHRLDLGRPTGSCGAMSCHFIAMLLKAGDFLATLHRFDVFKPRGYPRSKLVDALIRVTPFDRKRYFLMTFADCHLDHP